MVTASIIFLEMAMALLNIALFFKNHLAVGLENVNFNIVQRQLETRVDDSTDEGPLHSVS